MSRNSNPQIMRQTEHSILENPSRQVTARSLVFTALHLLGTPFGPTARYLKGERGFSFPEILVAMGILGLIGPVLLTSVSTNANAIRIADEKTQAEALARSQLEVVKDSVFLSCNPTPCYTPITNLPLQYTVTVDVQALDTPTCTVDGNCNTLQEITASVFRPDGAGSRLILAVAAYKVKK